MKDMLSDSKVDPAELRQQVAEGLFYNHMRLSQGTNKTPEASAFLYGFIELLIEKGRSTSRNSISERKRLESVCQSNSRSKVWA